MKKIISLCLAFLSLLMLLSLASCTNAEIDLREKDNVYDDLAAIISSPEQYKGKTVAISSTYTVVYDFSQNKILRHTISEFDASGEKRALYEIRKENGSYPKIGSEVTVIGSISGEGYIAVDRFRGAKKSVKFDYDTLELSAVELKSFIADYRSQYDKHEYFGKTVRIFGHLATDGKGYNYLIGLDSNGKYLWEIELYDPDGKFEYPTVEGNTVNPVEVIGELSTYYENDILYSCIKVKQIGRAESVFKSESSNNNVVPFQ